jgi:hypothetical protein
MGFSDDAGGSGTASVGIAGKPLGFAAGFGGPEGTSPSTSPPCFESSVGNGKADPGVESPEGAATGGLLTQAGSFDPGLHFFGCFRSCPTAQVSGSSKHAAVAIAFILVT